MGMSSGGGGGGGVGVSATVEQTHESEIFLAGFRKSKITGRHEPGAGDGGG